MLTRYLNVINVNITTNVSVTVPAFYSNLSVVVPTLKEYWKPYLMYESDEGISFL